jgi:hypothetical protein
MAASVLLPKKSLGFPCLLPAPPSVRLVSGGHRTMAAWWISALAGGRALFSVVSSRFVRVCVLLRKTRRRWLPEDGIRFSPLSPRPDGVSCIIGGRVEVSPADLSWVDLLGSGRSSSTFMCYQVGSF